MAKFHLCRVGMMSQVGRFLALDGDCYSRGQRVVVRTDRGLETAEVLLPPQEDERPAQQDGLILRAMTREDDLLELRLNKNRQTALEECSRLLEEQGLPVVLMDVEPLFDGENLFFYFLGETPAELADVITELAQTYDKQVQFSQFAELLETGCGPDCGTAEGSGCGSCATGCAIAAACSQAR
ncbi:PSP1 C-terminal domain-containing protein [Planctomycetales bacterium 10988]|nr:PSP1 C-terminal domain-containing protein [Planctomycetales bacterium 10988]